VKAKARHHSRPSSVCTHPAQPELADLHEATRTSGARSSDA